MLIDIAITALALAGGNFTEPVQVPDPAPAVAAPAPEPAVTSQVHVTCTDPDGFTFEYNGPEKTWTGDCVPFYELTCTVSADDPLTPEVEPGTFTMLYYGSDTAVAASPNCEAVR